jgi:integrase
MVIERAAPGMATQTVEEWRSTLGRLTTLNKTPVDKIDVPEVRAALPLDRWEQFPVQTKNTLARVARVLDAAAGDGHRDKYNPAEWRWHKAWVPARPKAADEEKHHPAMPWQDVPAFVQQLRARKDDLAARALEFLILTGARTDEVTGKVVNKEVRKAPMTWSEIDRAGRLWRIPGSRMKRGVRHVVPLSEAAIHLLKSYLVEATRYSKD